jgi:hypothetical protein
MIPDHWASVHYPPTIAERVRLYRETILADALSIFAMTSARLICAHIIETGAVLGLCDEEDDKDDNPGNYAKANECDDYPDVD